MTVRKKSLKRKVIAATAVLLIGIQFIRIDTPVTPLQPEMDFINNYQPQEAISSIVKAACYDCHSDETVFPWYNQIAPVQWWLADHVNHGKEHLNFSIWKSYSVKKQLHKLEECIEMIEEEEMPLNSYTWTHSEARLSKEQREELISWLKSLM